MNSVCACVCPAAIATAQIDERRHHAAWLNQEVQICTRETTKTGFHDKDFVIVVVFCVFGVTAEITVQ